MYRRPGHRGNDLSPIEILQRYKEMILRMPKKLSSTIPPLPKRSARRKVKLKPRNVLSEVRKKKEVKVQPVVEEEEEEEEDVDMTKKERMTFKPRKRKRAVMEEMKKKNVGDQSRTSVRRGNHSSQEDSQSPFNTSPFGNTNDDIDQPPKKKRRGTSLAHINEGKTLKRRGDHYNNSNNKEECIRYWSKSCHEFMIAAYTKETVEREKNESANLYKETGDFFKATARESDTLVSSCTTSRKTRRSRQRNKTASEATLVSEICYLGMVACYIQCFRIRKMDMKETGKEVYNIMNRKKKEQKKSEAPGDDEENLVRLKRDEVKKALFFVETSNLLVSAYSVLNKAYSLSPVHKDLLDFKMKEVIDLIEELLRKVIVIN